MKLLELFLSFLKIGLFSIGGGYAAMPLIREQVVVSHPWLTMSEFTDMITIAEMTPSIPQRSWACGWRESPAR